MFAKGLEEYRRGRLESAISIMEGPAAGVLGPAPRLVLSMARHGRGQAEDALKTLASAILSYDWRGTGRPPRCLDLPCAPPGSRDHDPARDDGFPPGKIPAAEQR